MSDFHYDEDYYELKDDYYEPFDYEDDFQVQNDFSQVLNCGFAVLKQLSVQFSYLFAVNFVYRIIRSCKSNFDFLREFKIFLLLPAPLPDFLKHLSSSLLGFLSTFIFFHEGNFYIWLLIFISYAHLRLIQIFLRHPRWQGLVMICVQLASIFTW